MQTHTEENHVKRQGEDGHLHAKERGPRRNQACSHLELRLLAPELRGNKSLLFKPPSLWYFTKAALAHYCTSQWRVRGHVEGNQGTPVHNQPTQSMSSTILDLLAASGLWTYEKA